MHAKYVSVQFWWLLTYPKSPWLLTTIRGTLLSHSNFDRLMSVAGIKHILLEVWTLKFSCGLGRLVLLSYLLRRHWRQWRDRKSWWKSPVGRWESVPDGRQRTHPWLPGSAPAGGWWQLNHDCAQGVLKVNRKCLRSNFYILDASK